MVPNIPRDFVVPGARLSHYEVVDLIGAGGSGRVYRARDTSAPRCVAIKTLKSFPAPACGCLALRSEAAALSRLAHPQIAQFYELFTDRGRDFIVMEFVPGATLDDVMKTGPLPTTEVLRLGIQMMRGLAAAHRAHVLHRDIKPGNLKITSSGELKILDFGLARFMAGEEIDNTSTDNDALAIVGTVPYMSPERLRGEAADQRADIFGAGAVLYEMATGRRAFGQRSLPHLLTAILFDAPLPATSIHPLVPEALSRVISKMLAKKASDRYATASLVVDELEALADVEAAALSRL
jgi:serine/threonine protein kinase